MACPDGLGAGEDYVVEVRPRGGGGVLGSLSPESITWSRRLDDLSQAEIVLGLPNPRRPCTSAGPGMDCCQVARELRTWGMEIHISRDGQKVWEGPIVHLDHRRDTLRVTARDVLAWVGRRQVHNLMDFRPGGLGPADLSRIAEALIFDALGPDDPNVLPFVTVFETGLTGERLYGDKPRYALDELNELARTGVDYTVLGRRIIISGELGLTRLPVLTADDLLGELSVVEDGLAAATRGVVVGGGVVGTCEQSDEFLGLLEQIATEDSILDQVSADAHACAIVDTGHPAPLYVDLPGAAQLACNAPVCINELVPGVLVPVLVGPDQMCRAVQSVLRLRSIEVSVNADGETVGVELAPIGAGEVT